MRDEIYVRAREPDTARRLIEELLNEGVPADRIRVHGRTPPDLPVKRVVYRSPATALWQGGLAGGGLLLVVAATLASLGGLGASDLLALPAVGVIVGSLAWHQRNRQRNGVLLRQEDALRRGELVVALAADQEQLARLEQRVEARHPEVSILGSDPSGTPPFP